MFGHIFKNAILVAVREKTNLFWSFVFPILLSTFMFLGFMGIMDKNEMFHNIPVALVEESANDSGLKIMLKEMAKDEDGMIDLKILSEEEAKKSLQKKEISGIIFEKDSSLIVRDNSVNSTILEELLKIYKQNEMMVKDSFLIGNSLNNFNVDELKKTMNDRTCYYKEVHFVEGSQNKFYNYFYAIFAMSCLFASFSSLSAISKIQGDCGALGMRRNIAPAHKLATIVAEFFALLCLQFAAQVISLFYMKILGIDFGNKILPIMLTLFFGCCIGLAIGVIIGAIKKLSEGWKIGLSISIGMILSVMADLCVGGFKNLIEKNIPIINRINPAALISDCFYSLSIYSDYSIFTRNIITLAIESVVLILVGYFMVRKTKYKEL